MKKQENKKFGFEKFELAKLKNSKIIRGGVTITITDTTDKGSTQKCNDSGDDSSIRCILDIIFGVD